MTISGKNLQHEKEMPGMQLQNPQKQYPKISKTAWIAETAVIVGNVTIKDDVFVGPNAVIRADEPGSSIVIESRCNVQDNVVVHGLGDSEVIIGGSSSLAHGCIVHGPCRIGEGCFVGFGAVVFDCSIGKDTVILHNTTVRGVELPSCKVLPDGMTVTSQTGVSDLEDLTRDLEEFKKSVVEANIHLLEGYKKLAEGEEEEEEEEEEGGKEGFKDFILTKTEDPVKEESG